MAALKAEYHGRVSPNCDKTTALVATPHRAFRLIVDSYQFTHPNSRTTLSP